MAPRRRTLLLDLVGLTPALVGVDTPHLAALARSGSLGALEAAFPAVTCTGQASLLSGKLPREHGIVANGWFFRDLQEVWLWRQSHALLLAEDLHARVLREHPGSNVARLFLWYAMGAPGSHVVTPRPRYKADGRKLPDVWTHPSNLRDQLQRRLGTFPLFSFWGPGAGLNSSRWIVDAAREVLRTADPVLLSVYVPHLDYDFQRHGPDHPQCRQALRDLDATLGPLLDDVRAREMTVVVVSEYGITAVRRPVHPNRALREAGLLAVRDEDGGEILDPVASRAFAVADHQVAHVYVRSPTDVPAARDALARVPGVGRILAGPALAAEGLDHPRSGDLVLESERDAWFTYYYWLDDARAPDFARCVDIHRKPGYDPMELLIDPRIGSPKLALAARLARQKLGFRGTFDVIGLDASVVRGSHGLRPARSADGPVIITSVPDARLDPDRPFPLGRFPDLVMDTLR